MKFVFNASPLIHLARAGLASLIEELEGEKYTVPAVFHEVVEVGKSMGYADALVSEELINKRILTVKSPQTRTLRTISGAHRDLHAGESEVIALSKEIGATTILDDSIARAIAKMHNVRTEGTYMIIFRTLRKGVIDKAYAENCLERLISSGWRCDVELYNRLMRILRES
ncbi:MAG: DUF3368 domain-containing protein [Nitrososphaerales archaeon]